VFAEDEPLPGDWKRMPEFDRLLLFRALRPDRLTAAMRKFVTNMIGAKYVTSQPYDLERSFQDSSPGTPIFVFLSPGVDVVSRKSGHPKISPLEGCRSCCFTVLVGTLAPCHGGGLVLQHDDVKVCRINTACVIDCSKPCVSRAAGCFC
jgi:hypothetical protein